MKSNPNLDQMAAALGLYLSLQQAGKQVAVASPTEPVVEISNLVGIDKVKKSLVASGGDIIVAFPYQEGDVEKVSYNIEDGFFNIIVRAAEKGLRFHEKEVQIKRGGKPLHLLFAIGVPRLSEVSSAIGELHKNAIIVNLDNKQDNEQFGHVVVVSPKFSSLSEQIADLLTLPDSGLPIDQDIAQNLLSGITYATNDFQDSKTSHLAFEMAGILMRKGAKRKRLSTEEAKPQINQERPQQQFITKPQPTFTPKPQVRNAPVPPMAPRSSQQQTNFQPKQPFVPQAPRPVQPPQQPTQQPRPLTSQTMPQLPKTEEVSQQNNEIKEAPADWLQPKVYEGSSIVE